MPHPPLRSFHVGWICPLPTEHAAARTILDEDLGHLEGQEAEDPNVYTLGRIGNHYVVITCLLSGQRGSTPAATVAHEILRTFDPPYDIRQGDIVISHGGVIRVSTGKGGEIQCMGGPLASLHTQILTALVHMEFRQFTHGHRYPSYIQGATHHTQRTPRIFARPEHDSLYKIVHEHPKDAKDCDGGQPGWVHYGINASGDVLINSGDLRVELREKRGASVFDKEAAGLMRDFPPIVIRGMSNYCDTPKDAQNAQWDGFAALAAASYAKELLGCIPSACLKEEAYK
ncbi:nucleoside phosphorylase domain-containing protein [Aspergillus floccosus]